MLRIKEATAAVPSKGNWIGPAPWIEVPPPGILAQTALERGRRVTPPGYARHLPLVVRRAQGSVIEDVDGNRYLDFAASVNGAVTGHANDKIIAAIREQAAHLIHPSGCGCYTEPTIALAERLAALAPGRVHRRVLFTNSGAEAVDAAVKLVRQHAGRPWLVAFQGAFHGRTLGALSLSSAEAAETRGCGPLVPMIARAPYGDIDLFERAVFQQQVVPDEIAAVFVEPVLGLGGHIVPPRNFLPRLRALCDRHGILLVCDEIQTGLGRTGKMFACQRFGVVPDVLLCARGLAGGLPLGAVIGTDALMGASADAQRGTFCANSVSCTAALATLDLLDGGLTANAARLEPGFQRHLSNIVDKHRCVVAPRGLGLMAAVDLVSRKSGTARPRLLPRRAHPRLLHGRSAAGTPRPRITC